MCEKLCLILHVLLRYKALLPEASSHNWHPIILSMALRPTNHMLLLLNRSQRFVAAA